MAHSKHKNWLASGLILLALLGSFYQPSFAQRQMERLGRGVIAIHQGEGMKPPPQPAIVTPRLKR